MGEQSTVKHRDYVSTGVSGLEMGEQSAVRPKD